MVKKNICSACGASLTVSNVSSGMVICKYCGQVCKIGGESGVVKNENSRIIDKKGIQNNPKVERKSASGNLPKPKRKIAKIFFVLAGFSFVISFILYNASAELFYFTEFGLSELRNGEVISEGIFTEKGGSYKGEFLLEVDDASGMKVDAKLIKQKENGEEKEMQNINFMLGVKQNNVMKNKDFTISNSGNYFFKINTQNIPESAEGRLSLSIKKYTVPVFLAFANFTLLIFGVIFWRKGK